MLLGARQFFASKPAPALPYDAEVEWLSNGGTAYIDSGILGCDGIGFEVTARGDNSWTTGYPTGWWNDYESSIKQKWTFALWAASQYSKIKYAVGLGRLGASEFSTSTSQRSFVSYGIDTYTGNLTFDGEIKATGLFLPLQKPPPWPTLKVFAQMSTNKKTSPVVSSDSYKIARMVFTIKGNIVRDFQPVRFTNEQNQSEGAMYDRVSGSLFRNASTGAFTVGPDKS